MTSSERLTEVETFEYTANHQSHRVSRATGPNVKPYPLIGLLLYGVRYTLNYTFHCGVRLQQCKYLEKAVHLNART